MNNSIFKNNEDWEYNSIIRRDATNEWIFYVEGYRIAAEKLIDSVIETKDERDTLIYPIVFLYRHYIEIQLKEIIQIGTKYLGEKSKVSKGHKLFPLWLEAKILINKIWNSDTENTSEGQAEEIIKLICEIDTKSDSFRYPFDYKGNQTLKGITTINIKELKEIITQLVQFLDGVSLAISAYADNKDEMQDDY